MNIPFRGLLFCLLCIFVQLQIVICILRFRVACARSECIVYITRAYCTISVPHRTQWASVDCEQQKDAASNEYIPTNCWFIYHSTLWNEFVMCLQPIDDQDIPIIICHCQSSSIFNIPFSNLFGVEYRNTVKNIEIQEQSYCGLWTCSCPHLEQLFYYRTPIIYFIPKHQLSDQS